MLSTIAASFGPPNGAGSRLLRSYAMTSGGVARRDRELVQVQLVAVAGAHGGDSACSWCRDLAHAVTVTDEQRSLPPGQHRLVLIGLDAEVGRDLALHRLEPDHLAAVVDDHRAVLAAARLGREEDEPGCGAGRVGRDGHRGRREVLARGEGLDGAAADIGRLDGAQRAPRLVADLERIVAALGADDVAVGADRDLLVRGERLVGHEAGALAVGVRLEGPGMGPAPRALDGDVPIDAASPPRNVIWVLAEAVSVPGRG